MEERENMLEDEKDTMQTEAAQQEAPEPETGQAEPTGESTEEVTEGTTEEPTEEITEEPTEEPTEEITSDEQEGTMEGTTETDVEITPEPEAAQEGDTAQETPQTEPEDETAAPILGSGRAGLGSQLTPAVVTPTPGMTAPGATLLASNSDSTAADEETDEEYETLNVNELDIVKLGRQGEHETQDVAIDCAAWLEKLPGCTLMIAAIRPGENEIYLPVVDVEDGVITWTIRDTDTANGGWGRGEVRAMLDGKIKKSAVFRTRIEPSLEGSGSTPATPPDWVQEILGAVQAAQEAAEAAAAAAIQTEANTRGLAGWTLTKEADNTVTIDYEESEG